MATLSRYIRQQKKFTGNAANYQIKLQQLKTSHGRNNSDISQFQPSVSVVHNQSIEKTLPQHQSRIHSINSVSPLDNRFSHNELHTKSMAPFLQHIKTGDSNVEQFKITPRLNGSKVQNSTQQASNEDYKKTSEFFI